MGSIKVKAIILANENPDDHGLWINACDEFKDEIEYRLVNLTTSDWLEKIQAHPFDILLAKPGGITSHFKQLYDERIYILGKVLNFKVFPSPEEIFIYENKRLLSYWLKAQNIPHPKTSVFYYKNEVFKFLEKVSFPLVAKVNIGASGSGVKILKNIEEAISYVNNAFSEKGISKRWGPDFKKKGIIKRGIKKLLSPNELNEKLKIYADRKSDIQKNLIIFQEYINHDFEWRVVRIGDSFFAHKKLKLGEKASGSLLKNYENPPLEILDFVRDITDELNFYSMAVDIFETESGKYLVNEMQCIFGQSDPYQMLVNGKPGRYRFVESNWKFEEGDFAINECYNLRVQHILYSN